MFDHKVAILSYSWQPHCRNIKTHQSRIKSQQYFYIHTNTHPAIKFPPNSQTIKMKLVLLVIYFHVAPVKYVHLSSNYFRLRLQTVYCECSEKAFRISLLLQSKMYKKTSQIFCAEPPETDLFSSSALNSVSEVGAGLFPPFLSGWGLHTGSVIALM